VLLSIIWRRASACKNCLYDPYAHFPWDVSRLVNADTPYELSDIGHATFNIVERCLQIEKRLMRREEKVAGCWSTWQGGGSTLAYERLSNEMLCTRPNGYLPLDGEERGAQGWCTKL